MNWLIITDEAEFAGGAHMLASLGEDFSAVVVGTQSLADRAATCGAREVKFFELDGPVEAYGPAIRDLAMLDQPVLTVTSSAPGARSLAASIAGAIGGVVIPNVVASPGAGVFERTAISQATLERLSVVGAVIAIFSGNDDVELVGDEAPITPCSGELLDVSSRFVESSSETGLADAKTVVGVGRGLKNKEDIALIARLADTLGAEIGCSMPLADDLAWFPTTSYIGRSGQSISPRLYLACGIAGAPQHMEGVRGAKVVAAINNDPEAHIFRSVDYGIIGDLYEVIPALIGKLNT